MHTDRIRVQGFCGLEEQKPCPCSSVFQKSSVMSEFRSRLLSHMPLRKPFMNNSGYEPLLTRTVLIVWRMMTESSSHDICFI